MQTTLQDGLFSFGAWFISTRAAAMANPELTPIVPNEPASNLNIDRKGIPCTTEVIYCFDKIFADRNVQKTDA